MDRRNVYIAGEHDRMLAIRHSEVAVPVERHSWGGIGVADDLVMRELGRMGFSVVDETEFGVYLSRPTLFRDYDTESFSGALVVDGAGYESLTTGQESLGSYLDDWSLCVIKPDAKQLGMIHDVHAGIRRFGLETYMQIRNVDLSQAQLDQLWPSPLDEYGQPIAETPWWRSTIDYMTSGDVDVLLVGGEDAAAKMKRLKEGLRDEVYGPGLRYRTDLPVEERVKSIIHSSDNPLEFATNALGFFTPAELIVRMGA